MPAEHRVIFSRTPSVTYVIPGERHLYLDTSVVRRFGRRLVSWPHRHASYTSALTFIEILNGVAKSDSEFRRRQSAIKALHDAEIAVDWHMPDIKMRLMFSKLRKKFDIYEKRTECLQRLIRFVREARAREHLLELDQDPKQEFNLAYFNDLDERMVQSHLAAFNKWVDFNRESFAHPSTAKLFAMFDLPPDTSIADACEQMTNTGFSYFIGIHSLGRKFASEQRIHGRRKVGSLVDSYDPAANLYIRASDRQNWREIGLRAEPQRNTGPDLHHLLYVMPGATVVTTDVGLANVVREAGGVVADNAALGVGA